MTMIRTIGKRKALFAVLLLGLVASAVNVVEQTANIPSPFNAKETAFQNQTHFLVFTGSDTPGESTLTATAYYNAIDPYYAKRDFPHWLLNAGFISDTSQWHATGPQLVACDLGPANGCDMPAHDGGGNLVYGDNIINTDSHAIVLNAADLGFVRNQFVRCKPSCSAPNPIIYTYLENYPVNPFSASGNGGTGFPLKTGFPTVSEGSAAVLSALNRPAVHDLAGCDPTKTDTPFKCKISRIADVAFEWAPPSTSPTSSTRYGQQYAYIFDDSGATPTETLAFPGGGDQNCNDAGALCTTNVTTKTLQPFNGLQTAGAGVFAVVLSSGGTGYNSTPTVSITGGGGSGATAVATIANGAVTRVTLTNAGVGYTSAPTVSLNGGTAGTPGSAVASTGNPYTGTNADIFPPNLDFIGFKQHPGVCYICHGGNPQKLTSTGAYPNQGNVSGFRFLPLDIRNLMFSSDAGLTSSAGDQPAANGSLAYTDRAHQELQIKKYNQAVLATVPTTASKNGTTSRVAHLREVILGWYAAYAGDTTMSSNVQNGFWQTAYGQDFVPNGWLEPSHGGTAPPGSEQLYLQVVSPSCRSCHFNRELSLDFGTVANFKQGSNVLQLAVLPGCSVVRPGIYSPKAGAKYMPLAHLTYQRYWEANASTGGTTKILPYPAPGLAISNTADQIAAYFGYGSVAGYCATNP